ncbi:MAG: glycoside hydrolase family 43 protein [Chloroflexota bacterium]|nr:glycoside hydrolase family 43 protein [Chloroflexota bacterium]
MNKSGRSLPILLGIAALLAACSSSDPAGGEGSSLGEPGTSGAEASERTAAPESTSPRPSPQDGEFVNPVLRNFPDPDVQQVGDSFYAYATTNFMAASGSGSHIQVARSSDLINWERLPDALPELAPWSGLTPLFRAQPHSATWAPDVQQIDDRFVMYYTTPASEIPRPDGKPSQCLSVAISDAPEGPFVDESEGPLACQPDLGGSIDGSYFKDHDGTQYLVWKNDGNCCGQPTNFWLQELTAEGTAVTGEPVQLAGLANDDAWEGGVIESPQILIHEGRYYIFYSGNDFASGSYAVGYATAHALEGPYTDAEENPILFTDFKTAPALGMAGPGHQGIFTDEDGDLWMAYHAWDNTAIGNDSVGRHLWLDELLFEDGKPVIDGPDAEPQAVP